MKYAYEDLGDSQFEDLVVILCQTLFGISVQRFSSGPDGGRDGRFVGTAERYPSRASPWDGTVIIQAKHTNGYNRSFAETDFYSPSSSNTILAKEIPRIKKLRASGEMDYYMLFANRRLPAITCSDICGHIATECGIPTPSISLCGVEQMELWLKEFPDVARKAGIDPIDSPLIVSPDEIAEVVQAFARARDSLSSSMEHAPTPRVPYETKNELNNMRTSYAKEQRNRYLKETRQVQAFLAAPENADVRRAYESATEELQLQITAKRRADQTFDEVMEYIARLLFDRDPVLNQRAHKRLTRVLLFYMYWNCDIGEAGDA